jgi:hypothetical protein
LFPYAAFFLLLGLVTMMFVRHGDGMSEHDAEIMQEHIDVMAAEEMAHHLSQETDGTVTEISSGTEGQSAE